MSKRRVFCDHGIAFNFCIVCWSEKDEKKRADTNIDRSRVQAGEEEQARTLGPKWTTNNDSSSQQRVELET